ncbi:MAG: hypothetical protein HGA31_00690 [Candidatus Moranbacteria bacterium]|nr:hypothetical protein [Candidatus Moranbacteria bacterium]
MLQLSHCLALLLTVIGIPVVAGLSILLWYPMVEFFSWAWKAVRKRISFVPVQPYPAFRFATAVALLAIFSFGGFQVTRHVQVVPCEKGRLQAGLIGADSKPHVLFSVMVLR